MINSLVFYEALHNLLCAHHLHYSLGREGGGREGWRYVEREGGREGGRREEEGRMREGELIYL